MIVKILMRILWDCKRLHQFILVDCCYWAIWLIPCFLICMRPARLSVWRSQPHTASPDPRSRLPCQGQYIYIILCSLRAVLKLHDSQLMNTEASVISIVSSLNKAHLLKATHLSLITWQLWSSVSFQIGEDNSCIEEDWVFLSKFKIINTHSNQLKGQDKLTVSRKFTV